MTESEDSIESYWEVARPHLVERARLRRQYQEDIKLAIINHYIGRCETEKFKSIRDEGYRITENQPLYNRGYVKLEHRMMSSNGYKFKNRRGH